MAILIIIIIFRKPPTPFSLGMSPGCRSPEGQAHAENDLVVNHFDSQISNQYLKHFCWIFCFWSILFLPNLFSLFWRLSPASRQATRTQLSVEEEPGLFLWWNHIYSFLSLNMLIWTYISNYWENVLYSYDHMTANKICRMSVGRPVHSCSTFRQISELCDLEVVCNI